MTPKLDPISLKLPNEFLEPADAGDLHTDLHNDKLSFANTSISLQTGAITNKKCDTTGCEFTVPVRKANFISDLTLSAVGEGKKKPLFQGKRISMSLNPNGATPFEIKVKLNPNGQLTNLIWVDPKQISFSLNRNALKLDIATTKKQDDAIGIKVSVGIYDELSKIDGYKRWLRPAKTPAEKQGAIHALSFGPDDFKKLSPEDRQAYTNFMEAYQHAESRNLVETNAPAYFNKDVQSAKLFESGQWLFDQLEQNPDFMKTVNDLIAKQGIPALSKTINDRLSQLPLIKDPIKVHVPFVRMQDLEDQSSVQQVSDDQSKRLAQLVGEIQSQGSSRGVDAELKNFQDMMNKVNGITNRSGLADPLQKNLDSWAQLMTAIEQSGMADKDPSLRSKLQDVQGQLQTQINASKEMQSPGDDFDLSIAAVSYDQLRQGVQAMVKACSHCPHGPVTPPSGVTPLDFKQLNGHDVGIKVDLAAMNKYLKLMSWDVRFGGGRPLTLMKPPVCGGTKAFRQNPCRLLRGWSSSAPAERFPSRLGPRRMANICARILKTAYLSGFCTSRTPVPKPSSSASLRKSCFRFRSFRRSG